MIVVLVSSPLDFNAERLFVDLRSVLGHPLFLKCEGFNFTGSIKMKAALAMVEAAELSGRLRPGSVLVESSSGNLGVALSMIAASRGYGFVCVTDMRCNPTTRRMMEALGARVHVDPRTRPEGRLPRRPHRLRAGPVRFRPALRVAGPVRQPRTTGGRTSAPPRLRSQTSSRSWTCCSSARARRGR